MNKGGARGMTNITSTPVNSYNFTGLKAETKYEVGIAAMANKEGPMAKFTFTTTLGREYTPKLSFVIPVLLSPERTRNHCCENRMFSINVSPFSYFKIASQEAKMFF